MREEAQNMPDPDTEHYVSTFSRGESPAEEVDPDSPAWAGWPRDVQPGAVRSP